MLRASMLGEVYGHKDKQAQQVFLRTFRGGHSSHKLFTSGQYVLLVLKSIKPTTSRLLTMKSISTNKAPAFLHEVLLVKPRMTPNI